MEASGPPPDPIPLSKPIAIGGPTLKQEWLLIAVVGVLVAACLTIDAFVFPKEFDEGKHTPLTWVAVILAALGHGGWITLDRNRRGRNIGYWRFGAIFLGPVAIAIYLMLEYRLRALYLIPLVVAIYLAVSLIPMLILLITNRAT